MRLSNRLPSLPTRWIWKVVGLEAVHTGCYLRNFVPTLKLENRDAGCLIFVRDEILPRRLRVIAGDLLDLLIHEKQQGIKGVATRCQQAAAGEVFFDVPTVLTVPRSDAVVIVHLAVVQIAEQALVND